MSFVRAWLRSVPLLALAVQFVAMDALFRGAAAFSSARACLGAAGSVALSCLLASLATTRPRRVAYALVTATLLVVQASVFRYYHVPLDVQVAASAIHAFRDVKPVLLGSIPTLLFAIAIAGAASYALLAASPRAAWSAKRPVRLGLAAFAGFALLLGPPARSATPEIRAVSSLAAVFDRPRSATAGGPSPALPPLHGDRRAMPSVLFVLTESVRADDYDASTAPETLAATPGRVDLAEMRAVSSYTAVSLSAILTGRSQEGGREEIVRGPNMFDFASAARGSEGAKPTVAYWSSQSREVFETPEERAALDRFVSIETLVGRDPDVSEEDPLTEQGVDRLVVSRFESDVATIEGPLFAVLHLIDTHAPYVVDPARAPFQPVDHVVAWSRMEKLHNAYKDAIYMQDALVARAVRAFVARAGARPWAVVLTSDHGEAFGEHGAIHHGQNLFDEQVHVPAFLAWGNGALDAAQAAALSANRGVFSTHLDLLPTLLDLLGVWDNFGVREHRAAMRGESLLRQRRPSAPVPATNCTKMFPCPINTWGLYGRDRKLIARTYDGDFSCYVVGGGPERFAEQGDPACAELRSASLRTFPLLPNGAPNVAKH